MNETAKMFIKSLEELRTQKEDIQARLKGIDEQINRRSNELRTLVAAGVGTGDRLRDLVISYAGYWPELEDRCRAVEAAMEGRTGELVLICYPSRERTRHRFGLGWDTEEREAYRMGILSGPNLILRKDHTFNMLTLPVGAYIEGFVHPHDHFAPFEEKDVHKDNLFCVYHSYVGRPPSLSSLLQEKGDFWKDYLLIGDEAVKVWLEEKRMKELLPHALRALAGLVPQLA